MIVTLTQTVSFMGEDYQRTLEYHIPWSLILERVIELDVQLNAVLSNAKA